MQVEGFEDRPERQEGVDAFGGHSQQTAVRIADALPIDDGTTGECCGEHCRTAVITGIGGQILHGCVGSGV